MRFEQYLKEMSDSIDISGYTITKSVLKKMKKKYKTADEFIDHLKSKVKKMTSAEEHRVRAAYNEL